MVLVETDAGGEIAKLRLCVNRNWPSVGRCLVALLAAI